MKARSASSPRRGGSLPHPEPRPVEHAGETRYLGFLAIGEAMQTNTWTDFVNRVAAATGRGVLGVVHAETCQIADADDGDAAWSPTFQARGD